MSTFYIKNEQKAENIIKIIGKDVRHIKNVLRYSVGDTLKVCDEGGIKYLTKILKYTENNEVLCEIQSIDSQKSETSYSITLLQGLPKSDKMEFIIQKGTELGVQEFVPVEMERSVVKLDDKNTAKKLERWNKIALEASKQCSRQKVPTVSEVINFQNIIENIRKYDIVLVPYENEKTQTLKQILKNFNENIANIAVMIGPEGGFSDIEIEKLMNSGAKLCTLGPRILRTETAGIATVAMINYEFEL